MPQKLIRCVSAIQKKGGPNVKYAWPICIKSTGMHPHNKKKGGKNK